MTKTVLNQKHTVTISCIAVTFLAFFSIMAYAEEPIIPSWIKSTALWWSDNQIQDSDFVRGLEYLIKEGIITIPKTEQAESDGTQQIPSWLKKNAGWWSQGLISDEEFVRGIQWLVNNKILVIPDEEISETNTITLSEGEREGPLLIENILEDRVEGLQFLEYPVANYQGNPISLHIGQSVSNGCTVTLKLIKIDNEVATFEKEEDFDKVCPICLAGDTLIDTPNGPVSIKQLEEGMVVWTVDSSGTRQIGTIVKTQRSIVLQDHKMVFIVLDDGRQILASPAHPLSDGRLFNDILPGTLVDNHRVIHVDMLPYALPTYDILPSGETGLYWANSILVQSTLHRTTLEILD